MGSRPIIPAVLFRSTRVLPVTAMSMISTVDMRDLFTMVRSHFQLVWRINLSFEVTLNIAD